MQLKYIWALTLYFASAAAGVCQVAVPVLDMTKALPCTDTRRTGSASGGGVSVEGQPPPSLPFSLRLVDISPNSFRWYDRIVYEVELENNGTTAVRIPWGTICDVHPEDPQLVIACIFLTLSGDPAGRSLGFTSIHGSRSDEKTTRVVAPGERVRIRIGALASGATTDDPVRKKLETQSTITITVIANFAFLQGADRDYVQLHSGNSLSVEVLKWKQP
ncbi:hypothetical protein [uncultured Paludibaculum sp.]|uniref:hypothetical protein n=1 Tax=uncultured Paludibaculum sp. TaxID=1765020 RepID=UPI002AAC039E|nr:hypothetical protein [uncultured Paludibaculum sp.]